MLLLQDISFLSDHLTTKNYMIQPVLLIQFRQSPDKILFLAIILERSVPLSCPSLSQYSGSELTFGPSTAAFSVDLPQLVWDSLVQA